MKIIQFKKVSFKAPSNMHNLEKINLDIEEGKTYGIIGGNNNGKTSLITLLAGLNKPSSGEIYFNNKIVKSLEKYRLKNIGLLLNFSTLLEEETVEENLALVSQINGKAVKRKNIISFLKKVSLDETYLEKKVFTLNELEKQQISLARILIKNSKIILANNPTENLNEVETDKFLEIILNICNENKTTLIVSTSSYYTCKDLDHVYGMNSGRINYIK